MPDNPEIAIAIDHLNCVFRKGEALHDITLQIPRGCVFGLVGLNGAGKTTLIRHLIGSFRPQSGRVRVLGQDPTIRPEILMQRIGYVAEEDALPRWMTVGELIDFMRALYRDWDAALCDDLLNRFGLRAHHKLADLSKGGRARAGLLVAIAHRPDLLILDEPSYGLDPIARRDILETVVRSAGDQGRTVLFSSHLLDEVSRICDTVGVICDGRILEVVSNQELADRYAEVICESFGDDLLGQQTSEGLFGWHKQGREWSVVADRTIYSNDDQLQAALGAAQIRQVRTISLDRWFSARVSQPPSGDSKLLSEAVTS